MTTPPADAPETADAVDSTAVAADLRSLFGRGFVYSASDAATAAVSLVVVPIYARHLSTADFGVYGFLAGARQFLAPLLGLGLVSSLRTLYHLGSEEQRARVVPTIVNAALLYSFAATLLLSVAGSLFLAADGDRSPYMPHLLLTAWTVFAMSFYFVPLTIFSLDHRPTRYAAYSFTVAASNLVLNVALVVVLDRGLVGALSANLGSALVGLALAAIVVRHRYRAAIDRVQLRTALRIALPTLPHTILSSAWRFSDRFFLTTLATLSQTGIYSLAAAIGSAIPLGLGGLSTAFGAEFYRRTGVDDEAFPRRWARLFTVYVAITASLWLAFANFAPIIVSAVGGDRYEDATDVLAVLALGHALFAVGWHFAPGVERAQRTWLYVVATLPAFVVNVVLNLLLVPPWGASGAAIAFSTATAVQVAVFGWQSTRAFPFPIEVRSLLLVVGLAAGCHAVTFIGDATGSGAIDNVLRVASLLAYPLALMALHVLPVDEVRWLFRRRH